MAKACGKGVFLGRDARDPAGLVILSAGGEAAGVEGPHRLRTLAAAAYPGRDARDPARVRRFGRKRLATCGKAAVKGRWTYFSIGPAGFVILSVASLRASGVEGSHWWQRLAARGSSSVGMRAALPALSS